MIDTALPRPRAAVRTLITVAVMLVVAAMTAVLPATAAHAETGREGWIRLTHLSPDTPAVDVKLTALAGDREVVTLKDVSYGDVSGYQRVPAGTYVASMVPAGGDVNSTPAISQAVEVQSGKAYTVAAVGRNAELKGTVLTDDLAPAAQGSAKIRLLQASISAPTVTVTAMGGPTLARDARFGTASGYAEVPAGVWSVTITPTEGDAKPVTTDVQVGSATSNTVVVLDREGGGLTALVVKDAEGTKTMPKGGVETGGGFAAQGPTEAPGSAVSAGLAAATLIAVAGAMTLARRRRATAVETDRSGG